jgi:D-alanyl-D-alanine carboxypeptidase/D-alanyl-D-alanine-endopeptidase (penicillin-binding protein 4)
VFTRLWRELGGTFSGQLRDRAAPASAIPLAASESPALGELVRDINKFSNNVMARQLFLKLGAGETALADKNIRDWLVKKRLDFPELVLDNGSGLSRRERISADHLAQLLAVTWASPIIPELMASLPIVALDGTAKKRYNGVSYAGQAHLKTGSLEGVRGIAGYLLDQRGKRHIVVFIVNHPNAAQAQPAFDALLDWLWHGAS